jgi:hypothetical protein
MSMLKQSRRTRHIAQSLIVLLILSLVLSACSQSTPKPTSGPTASPQPTVAPTATNTPQPTNRAVLVGAPEADAQSYPAVESVLKELASQSSLEFASLPEIQASQIGPETKVVVFLTPPANLTDLLNAAPQTQFVVVSAQDLPQAANLSVIRTRPEYLAFTAGYISAMSADDWRAGALLPSDGVLGAGLADAFLNGGHYFCGECNSYYAPVILFPEAISQPAATDLNTWQTTWQQYISDIVYVVYVDPQIATPEMLTALASQGFYLLGGKIPPDDVLPRWVATVSFDYATPLRTLWPNLIGGEGAPAGGKTVSAGIQFSDVHAELFTQGKQDLAARMLPTLTADLIQVYSPAQ